MAHMSFDDQQSAGPEKRKEGKIVKFLVKRGIAKDEKRANTILLGVAIVSFILMLMVIFSGRDVPPPPNDYNEDGFLEGT